MIAIQAVVIAPLLSQESPDLALSSEMYSSGILVQILDKTGEVVGDCDLLTDPLTQSEVNCHNAIG